jgi:hypothetical protein
MIAAEAAKYSRGGVDFLERPPPFDDEVVATEPHPSSEP